MESILAKLNHRMSRAIRSILLIMDNAGCHPVDLTLKYSNIKISFLPANTTSKLQTLDLGIIQNLKIDIICDKASDVAACINILIAIRCVAQAWSMWLSHSRFLNVSVRLECWTVSWKSFAKELKKTKTPFFLN